MALNEMKVSDLGLLNINRKIINSRKYDSNLISTIGEVTIFESKASNFTKDSYLYKSGLSFSKNNINITCSCNFTTIGRDQVAYLLKGENHSIALHFCDEQARLLVDDTVIIQFSYLKLEDNTEIRTIIKVTETSCNFMLYVHDLVFEKEAVLQSPITLSDLTKLYIGNEPECTGNYWIGSINLGTFTITEDRILNYSPSANYPLTFSKVLISDGEFKLTDKSFPIANHIYEFKISEITRSGGTVLLTSQIDDDSKLTIKEVGLYATTAEGEILFSQISNLSINKGDGVPYDLVFTMNLYAGFVNVVGFPDYNSFLLKEPELCLFQNFSSVKQLLLYIYTNLERIIDMNATDIGYNRSQVFYKLQQELAENEECYFTIENFEKISKKLKKIIEINFNPDAVTVHGNLIVPDNGITKDFSETDYISGNVLFENSKNWEIELAFKLEEKESGTLFTLRGPSAIQPLIFQTNYSLEEDKMYFHAKLGKNNTDNEFIIDADIFEFELGFQYYVKLKYIHDNSNEEDSYYEFLTSDDGEIYREVLTKYSPRIILPVRGFSIGAQSSYNSNTKNYSISNPFKGTFYVNTLKLISNSETWTPTTETVINPTQLLQYYHVPDLNKSRYVLQDLCNPEIYNLTVLETSITGNGDIIDFSNPEGFSLCMNVDLVDRKPKVLLAKTNLTDKPYLLLAFFDSTIYFYLFTKTKTIVLSKIVSDEEIASYLSGPLLLTVALQGNKMVLYKGTEVLASFQGMFGTFRNAKYASLTNFIQTSALKNICSNLNLSDISLDEYVAEIEDNKGRYIKNILAVEGFLTEEELYYINILMNS